MTQPDEAQPIQEFFQWIDKQREYSIIDPGSDERAELNSITPIKVYFKNNSYEKLNAILAALFIPEDPPDLAEVIVQSYTAGFSILLHIGKGKFIESFSERNSLDDGHLPLDPSSKPTSFPKSSDEGFFERFCKWQWRFSCPIFRRNHLNNEHFSENQVLPIAKKEQLGRGGSAVLFKIRLYNEYNELLPESIKKDLSPENANTFVLKTYASKDAEKSYKAEVAAFKRLKNTPHIIGYHGSYTHRDARHILLEYADKGDLENYFKQVKPPNNGQDIFQFWKNLLRLVAALMAIHETGSYGAPGSPPIFQGLHQDVKPENVLVVSSEQTVPYKWRFKLGDLGLSQFERLTNLKRRPAIDTQGTRTYGAPECYRADEILAAAQLPVTPDADVWSLGCILSEAARWVATGKQGLVAYREARWLETEQIPNFEDGNCFHDGQHILKSVHESHKATRHNLHRDDTVTQRVLEQLVDEMLHSEPGDRPSTRKLQVGVRKILNEAEADLRKKDMTVPTSPHRPPPPELPPGWAPTSYGLRHEYFDPSSRVDPRSAKIENPLFANPTEHSRSRSQIPDSEDRRLQSPLSRPKDVDESQLDIWQTLPGGANVGGRSKYRNRTQSVDLEHTQDPMPSSSLVQSRSYPMDTTAMKIENVSSNEALGDFEGSSEPRKTNFQHHSHEMRVISHKLRRQMKQWCEGIPRIESMGISTLNRFEVVYTLACPVLHPIMYNDLRRLIEQDQKRTGLKELESNQPLITVDIHCHMCDDKHKSRVKLVRLIEPLQYTLAEMKKMIGDVELKSSTPLTKEPGEAEISLATSSSSHPSSSNDHTDLFDAPIMAVDPTTPEKKYSGDSPLKLKLDKKTRPAYSFTSNGWNLLLWARDTDKIVIYNVTSQTPHEFSAAAVHLAAGGEDLYATVSKKGNMEDFRVHKVHDGGLLASKLLKTSIFSIAVSRNDEFVALGTLGKVLIYSTSNMQLACSHELPPNADPESKCQRVWFSTDSKKVIAVTRNTRGDDIYTYISDCISPSINHNMPHINVPSGHYKDFGVSSALYDNSCSYALVTTFTSTGAPTLFSLQNAPQIVRLDSLKRSLGSQIQCATTPPNSNLPEFVLINGDNNILSVHCSADSQWELKKLCKLGGGSIVYREELMAMAMPTQNSIYVFRIQGKQRVLTMICDGKMTTSDITKLISL